MNEAVWRVRAAAWELAALSFRYPGEELEGAVASGEWAEAAREIASALGLALPEGFGAGAPAGGLRPEATRLLVGAPEPACSPYEGVWAAKADGVQPFLFVSPRSMEVERFMKACGLGRPEGANEPLDHVAAECELLSWLASPAAPRRPPTPPSSRATPEPGCRPSRAPSPPSPAIPSTARPPCTWARLSGRLRRFWQRSHDMNDFSV